MAAVGQRTHTSPPPPSPRPASVPVLWSECDSVCVTAVMLYNVYMQGFI